MRRTPERRALDALLKLGVLNADRLTEDDVHGIALCLRRVKVADDVRIVESMIAGGGACLPEMCVNAHARMIGDDGRVLGVLDVYHLSNGATHTVGIADETGTCAYIDICGQRLPTTAMVGDGNDHAVRMNTRCISGGDRAMIRFERA